MNYNFLYIPFIKKMAVNSTKLLKWIPDRIYLKLLYRVRTGKKLNLNNPRRFNEKIQWLKLYDHNMDYIRMVDKYEAKAYVGEKCGKELIIPTLGVWDSFDEIDFDLLPRQFVLKCTHDSGGLVICKDKDTFDYVAAKKKISKSLQKNYYYQNREWAYKFIKPRIIAEQYMEDLRHNELCDYKFMCADGDVKCCFTCTERFSNDGLKVTFFDNEWNVMPFERHYPKSNKRIEKPENYEKMVQVAEELSKGLRFVRIDLYEINGKVYFGEITLYPGSGMEEFRPDEWDYKLGEWIDLRIEEAK